MYTVLTSATALCCIGYFLIVYSSSSSTLSLGPYLLAPEPSRHFCNKTGDDLQYDFQITVNSSSFYLNGAISAAYAAHWVGFRELEHVNCKMALSYPTLNRLYPPAINRTYLPDILKNAKNCSSFVEKYGFGRHPGPSKEEEDFPIAFVLLFHKDLDQVLFLLRAIYRPHNAYCLTVDTKSSVRFLDATRAIARCLPNVFLASQMEDIVYGGMSRLMADIHCFRDLLKHPVQWRYIINTPGQQFPLRTNLELVQILKVLRGTNDILGQTGSRIQADRYRLKHRYFVNKTTGETDLEATRFKHYPAPRGVKMVKCSAYGAFSRQFVRFVMTSKLARDLLKWCEQVYSPDELYWGTLNYNHVDPAPGGYLGNPNNNPWISSYAVWQKSMGHDRCLSTFVRDICIFSTADLPMITSKPYLFANKFYVTKHPAALHCLDQRIFNNTVSKTTIDLGVYRNITKRRLAFTDIRLLSESKATN